MDRRVLELLPDAEQGEWFLKTQVLPWYTGKAFSLDAAEVFQIRTVLTFLRSAGEQVGFSERLGLIKTLLKHALGIMTRIAKGESASKIFPEIAKGLIKAVVTETIETQVLVYFQEGFDRSADINQSSQVISLVLQIMKHLDIKN